MEQLERVDLRKYIHILLNRWWIILICLIISVGISAWIQLYVLKPVYSTTTTLFVGASEQNQKEAVKSGDIAFGKVLAANYQVLARSRRVTKSVIQELRLPISPESLANSIQVRLLPDTNIIEVNVIYTEAESAKKIANTLAKVFMEKIKEIFKIQNIQVLDPAETTYTIQSNPQKNIMIAGLIGIVVSIGIILFLEYLDNTLKKPEDIQEYLGLSTIGAIPLINEKKGIITLLKPKSPIAEAYRMIRTNISLSRTEQQPKSIVVTSSSSAEGKTTTLINLGMTMVQGGKKVLIIDADLRKPKVHEVLEIPNEKGIANVIENHKDYKESIQNIDGIDNLDVLTAGPIPLNPSELLDSKAMEYFLDLVQKEYDVVLLDTPPVANVTDAAILSNKVDGVILVVSSGKTDIKLGQRTKVILEKVNANFLGVVLNKITPIST